MFLSVPPTLISTLKKGPKKKKKTCFWITEWRWLHFQISLHTPENVEAEKVNTDTFHYYVLVDLSQQVFMNLILSHRSENLF